MTNHHLAQLSTLSISNHPSELHLKSRKYLSQACSRPKSHQVIIQATSRLPTIGPMWPRVPRGSTMHFHQSTCTRTILRISSTNHLSCGYEVQTTRLSLIRHYLISVSWDSLAPYPVGQERTSIHRSQWSRRSACYWTTTSQMAVHIARLS